MSENKLTKKCKECGVIKSLNDFANDRAKKDGKTGKCKECRNKHLKKFRRENKTEITEYQNCRT